MKNQKILLLVGSPKKGKSSSYSLGRIILDKLEERGTGTGTLYIHECIQSEEKMSDAIREIDSADTLLFAFPLYVDHLPAPVIRLLEEMACRNKEEKTRKEQRMMAIINCGFPETRQNRPASDIMKQFAIQMNITWLGSLELGMGGFIGGRPLDKAGGPAKPLIGKLAAIVPYLENGDALPEQIIRNFGKPLMPRWLYTTVGNFSWKRMTRKNRVDPYARPYHYRPD